MLSFRGEGVGPVTISKDSNYFCINFQFEVGYWLTLNIMKLLSDFLSFHSCKWKHICDGALMTVALMHD